VIATGETHSVREFCEKAFACLGMTIKWSGEGAAETGADTKSGKIVIRVDSKYFRLTEVDILLGDPAKAKQKLGWQPSVSFDKLVEIMAHADWDEVQGK
jgi:GDPmannose 4,6-dehydratase